MTGSMGLDDSSHMFHHNRWLLKFYAIDETACKMTSHQCVITGLVSAKKAIVYYLYTTAKKISKYSNIQIFKNIFETLF